MDDAYIGKSFILKVEEQYLQWDVIAHVDDGYVVTSHSVMFHIGFGASNHWKDCFLRSYLNDVWLSPIKRGLALKDISHTELLTYHTETSNDKIFILSKDEHKNWSSIFPPKAAPFWLRTAYGHLHASYVWIANPDGTHAGESVHSSNIGVVTAIFLSEDAIKALC